MRVESRHLIIKSITLQVHEHVSFGTVDSLKSYPVMKMSLTVLLGCTLTVSLVNTTVFVLDDKILFLFCRRALYRTFRRSERAFAVASVRTSVDDGGD